MTRRERHGTILRLVREREISTQNELAEALNELGEEVVQTTISRDIQDLDLVKVRGDNDRLVYAVRGTRDRDALRELGPALRRWAVAIEASDNVVVVSTPSGFAGALAEEIDIACHPDVLGTVAGENTILVVARENVTGAALRDDLKRHLEKGAG